MSTDRLPEPWHKLYGDEYESAVVEGVGAMVGTCMGYGEDAPFMTDALHKGLRAMAACCFDRGFHTRADEDHNCEAFADAEARGYQQAMAEVRRQSEVGN